MTYHALIENSKIKTIIVCEPDELYYRSGEWIKLSKIIHKDSSYNRQTKEFKGKDRSNLPKGKL